MKLARSTYYYRSRRAAAAKIIVRDRIVALCDEFPRYGYRRVTAQLKAEGTTINHKAVSRIMRENGLQVRPLRRFVRTTDSDHDSPIFPNLAAAFRPTGPNELWVADLTYVAIAVGFVYVGVILDAWSRRVVGYAISRRIDTRLTLAALQAAVETRRPPPGVSTTPIAVANMPPSYIVRPWLTLACAVRWADAATPMITPRPRVS